MFIRWVCSTAVPEASRSGIVACVTNRHWQSALVMILHISMITDRKAWVGFSLDGTAHDKSHHVAHVVVWMGFSNWTLGAVVSGEIRVVGGLFKMTFVCWLACWERVAESSNEVEVDVEEFDAFGVVGFGGGSFFCIDAGTASAILGSDRFGSRWRCVVFRAHGCIRSWCYGLSWFWRAWFSIWPSFVVYVGFTTSEKILLFYFWWSCDDKVRNTWKKYNQNTSINSLLWC